MTTVLDLAKELIARPSITPDDAGCQKIIAERLTRAGFYCEELPFENVSNLWARYGVAEPLLTFVGHTDVVPTGPENEWETNPFNPDVRDGYLYGRGAADMKGGLAAMIVAAEEFVTQHPTFNGSLAFLITSDEEGPSIHGTKKIIDILEKRQEKITYCIIAEPSSIETAGDQVRIGRRGSLHGKLIVQGKQGHVAHPHLAINPIHLAAPALNELATTLWDKGNEDFPATSFQISNIHAGTGASNVIPGHLDVTFNFRFSTAVTTHDLQERVLAILRKHGLVFDLTWEIGAEPFLTPHGKLITATQQAIKSLSNQETLLSTGGGTSDGRFIAPTGAEVVELGVSHATAHHINERARVTDLDFLVQCYKKILVDLLVG